MVLGPFWGGGTPGWRYSRTGYPWPGQDGGTPGWGTPKPGMWYPPGKGWGSPRDRTTEAVLATQRMVCLLHSRRRTFLFLEYVHAFKPRQY